MVLTGYGWLVILFLLLSVLLTRKVLKRYARPLGCMGVLWVYTLVAALGSLTVVFLPISVAYVFFAPERNVIMLCGIVFAMCIIVTAYFGILKYAFGGNMISWFINVRKFGLLIFVPLLMIAFDLLLIYAFFYGNGVDIAWVRITLGFFIFMLTVAVPGYLKMMWASYFAGDLEASEAALEEEKERQRQKKHFNNKPFA